MTLTLCKLDAKIKVMLIIIESGSTKSDWLIIEGENRVQHFTMGFNPFFHSSGFIEDTLINDPFLKEYFQKKVEIYFYGAGCSSDNLNKTVKAYKLYSKGKFYARSASDSLSWNLTNTKQTPSPLTLRYRMVNMLCPSKNN